MTGVVNEQGWTRTRQTPARSSAVLTNAAKAAGPPLLFGLRLWASVCLALYVAFWLELDNAFWAGTSAALVCQPHLGASLRKGWYRMIGTLVGAVAIVVLTACFPQERAAFLVGLALWGAACALVATLLRNFAAYAAALAGYTAAIIASDQLGATGGLDGQAFMLAVTRASEICIGIVCAGIVLAGTDFGGARRRLAALLAALSTEITAGFTGTLATPGSDRETQPVRRELARRVIALAPVIDETIRNPPDSVIIRRCCRGLWMVCSRLWPAGALWRRSSPGRRTTGPYRRRLPSCAGFRTSCDRRRGRRADTLDGRPRPPAPELRGGGADADGHPGRTPSRRLLADQTAQVLAGISHALDGLALLVADPGGPLRRQRRGLRLRVPDWLPALVNAGRAFVTIGAVAVFWIMTAWPNGASAITFAAIAVILFSPRADQAYATAMGFMVGTALAAVFAAIIEFAILPRLATFAGFSIVMGLYLVPTGALLAQWQKAMFAAMVGNFVPLLAPANQMSYDTLQFYNAALAIVIGSGVGALSFRLLPPLSPALRTRRLLALTLRDLRRVATVHDAQHVRRLGGPYVWPALGIAQSGRAVAALAALSGALGGQRDHLTAPYRPPARCWARTSTPRLRPWRKATARSRPHGLPDSTAASPPIQAPGPLLSGRAEGSLPSRERLPSMPPTSTQERPGEVHRDRPVRRLRCADLVADGRGWLVTIALRRVADHFGLLSYVWHPTLFVFAVYIILLSSMTLLVAR